jgi:hypothetical protein
MNIGSFLHVVGQMKVGIIEQERISYGRTGIALRKAIDGKTNYKA